MSVTPHKGYLLQRDKGRAIWFLNGLLTWKAGDAETGGRWELVEQLCPRGFAPPVHSHDVEAEGFYVLDGEVTFVLDDERVVAAPGSFVYVPAGCRHSFVVESAVAKFLTFVVPARLEPFIEELGQPAGTSSLPDPPLSLDVARFEAAAKKHGQKTWGPPPAPRT